MVRTLAARVPIDVAWRIAEMTYHPCHRIVFVDTVYSTRGDRWCDTRCADVCAICFHAGIGHVLRGTGRLPHLRWHAAYFFPFPSAHRLWYPAGDTNVYALVAPATYNVRPERRPLPLYRDGVAWVTRD